jgi:hypothetical protein
MNTFMRVVDSIRQWMECHTNAEWRDSMSKKCATLDDAYQSHADWNNDYCQSFGYSAAQANDDAAEKANNNESLPERHRLLLDTITKILLPRISSSMN